MNLITEEQINQAGVELLKIIIGKSNRFDAVHSPANASSTSLVFISTEEMLNQALQRKALGFIVLEKTFAQLQSLIPPHLSVWTTPHIQYAMTRVLPLFDKKTLYYPPVGVHPSAVVDATAIIDPLARIAAHAVIEAHATVGSEAVIGSHSVVQAHAKIGSKTIIHPHSVIGSFCEIGSRCIIASHVTIGSDGFGFFTDKTGRHHKVPQIGKVIIEDDCELGAHCAVDRAALEITLIKKGTKLDNFCHVAHNVEIGENALAAAGLKIAGSTKIGNNFTCSGSVDINGHIEICDKVILSGRAAVSSSIEQPGIYGGYPLENHRDNLRTLMSLPHLSKIRKQVNKIMLHLNLKET